MRKILFQIGGLRIFSYGFFVAVGILAATIWMLRQAKKEGKSPDIVIDSVLISIIAGIIGARLFFIFLYQPEYYLANPVEIFYIWEGGLAFYGGLLLGLICVLIYLYIVRIPILTYLDLAAPAMALGYGIGRFGCFMNGCCYGTVTTVPWGVVFPVIDGATRHPTQLYSMLSSFLIFIILLWIKHRGAGFRGQLFSLALILYGISRSIIELFRENTQLAAGSMEAPIAALIIAAAGGVIYLFLFLAKRKEILRQ